MYHILHIYIFIMNLHKCCYRHFPVGDRQAPTAVWNLWFRTNWQIIDKISVVHSTHIHISGGMNLKNFFISQHTDLSACFLLTQRPFFWHNPLTSFQILFTTATKEKNYMGYRWYICIFLLWTNYIHRQKPIKFLLVSNSKEQDVSDIAYTDNTC